MNPASGRPVTGYWFAPKGKGIGWGLPLNAKGWSMLVGFLILICGLPFVSMPVFFIAAVPLLIVFVVTVFVTGDPAGRHWRN